MENSGDQVEAPAYPAAAFAARLRGNAGPAAGLGNIDGLCDAVVPGLVLLPPGAPDAWMEAGSTVRASGWALAQNYAPLRGVALALGEAVVVCRYGLARPDVAQYFGRHEAGRSGFSVELDTADFAPGRYRARLLGIDAGGALVAAPASLELHIAALRPAGDFLAVPPRRTSSSSSSSPARRGAVRVAGIRTAARPSRRPARRAWTWSSAAAPSTGPRRARSRRSPRSSAPVRSSAAGAPATGPAARSRS